MRHEITTCAGVLRHTQGPGTVTVEHEDTDTLAALTVTDESGNKAQVFLDYAMTTRLMAALGAHAVDL